MTARYNGGSANSNLYLSSVDISGCEGDSASSESSACSPLNLYVRPPEPLEISVEHQCLEQGYENIYREGTDEFMKYSYPVLVQDPVSAAAIGMIPVELDIEGCYETQDRQQKKNENERVVPLHVLSRRRAQNRASQRAFRNRKEKRVKEIEEKLTDLQGWHSELIQSYKTLQNEYLAVKQEMETLRSKYENVDPGSRSYFAGIEEWDAPRPGPSDPLPFDFSALSYEPEEGEQEG